MRAGSPWNCTRSPARRIQRHSASSSANISSAARSVTRMSSGSPESAAQRNGPLPSQNSGRMYSGTKPGMSNASVDAGLHRLRADVVAVVERDRAALLQLEHRRDVPAHRVDRAALVVGRIGGAQPRRVGERQAVGHVADERVVRRGLIGDHVGREAALRRAPAARRRRCPAAPIERATPSRR